MFRNKRSYKNKGPRHPGNQHIWEMIVKMKKSADQRNIINLSTAYKKVLTSLQSYPIPILSMQQAESIEGIGPKIASKIFKANQKRYKDYFNENYLREQLMQQTQKSTLSKLNKLPSGKKVLKRTKPNQQVRRLLGIKGEPALYTQGSLVLICFKMMEDEHRNALTQVLEKFNIGGVDKATENSKEVREGGGGGDGDTEVAGGASGGVVKTEYFLGKEVRQFYEKSFYNGGIPGFCHKPSKKANKEQTGGGAAPASQNDQDQASKQNQADEVKVSKYRTDILNQLAKKEFLEKIEYTKDKKFGLTAKGRKIAVSHSQIVLNRQNGDSKDSETLNQINEEQNTHGSNKSLIQTQLTNFSGGNPENNKFMYKPREYDFESPETAKSKRSRSKKSTKLKNSKTAKNWSRSKISSQSPRTSTLGCKPTNRSKSRPTRSNLSK